MTNIIYWQVVLVLVFSLLVVSISWPTEEDNSKACTHITGSSDGDARCRAYCIMKKRKGGACKNKRCVCTDKEEEKEEEDDDDDDKRRKRQLDIDFDICRLYCKNPEIFAQYPIKEQCDCP